MWAKCTRCGWAGLHFPERSWQRSPDKCPVDDCNGKMRQLDLIEDIAHAFLQDLERGFKMQRVVHVRVNDEKAALRIDVDGLEPSFWVTWEVIRDKPQLAMEVVMRHFNRLAK